MQFQFSMRGNIMGNRFDFGKRNLPKREVSKKIYVFYHNNIEISCKLQHISKQLCNIDSSWLIKQYAYDFNITYHEILEKIDTPYQKYDKCLDKLCIINNDTIYIKNAKIQIDYFQNINYFETWLGNFQSY